MNANDKKYIKQRDFLFEIINDNMSGSAVIREKLIRLYRSILSAGNLSDKEVLFLLRHCSSAAIRAHPSMASLFNLVMFMQRTIKQCKRNSNFEKQILERINKYSEGIKSCEKKLTEAGAKLITQCSSILTYSYSSAVLEVLKLASAQGKRFKTICPEARPACEGISFAEALAQNKIMAKVIIDAGVYREIKSCDIIFVGADTVTSDGVINKTGTEWIVNSAGALKKPVYSAFTSEKLLPLSYSKKIKILNKPPEEVYKGNNKFIKAENIYFDNTPLDKFTGFVTEYGIIKSGSIKKRLNSLINVKRKKR